jgi:hypothetical protein
MQSLPASAVDRDASSEHTVDTQVPSSLNVGPAVVQGAPTVLQSLGGSMSASATEDHTATGSHAAQKSFQRRGTIGYGVALNVPPAV